MTSQYLRAATSEDIEYVAANMRQDDQDECLAMGKSPLETLVHGLSSSEPCFAVIEPKTGLPCAILGVNPDGAVWLLATDVIEKYPMTLVRRSRSFISDLYKYSNKERLYNWVSAKNEVHIKWLEWLGFIINYDYPVTINNVPFYYFERYRSV